MNDTHIFVYSSDKVSKIAALNRETLEVDFIHELDAHVTSEGVQLQGDKLYVLDQKGNLYTFL